MHFLTGDCIIAAYSELLKQLRVPTMHTDMSFGVSVNGGLFEWGSSSIMTFLGAWSNLLRPWFWLLLFDIIRLNLTSADDAIELQNDSHPAQLRDTSIDPEY